MASCFGGGTTENRTIVQSNDLPEYVKKGAEDNYNTAKTLSERAYQPFTGQRLAGFNQNQDTAINMVKDATGAWKPSFDAAKGIATNAANTNFTNANIKSYMNPYQDAVTQKTVDDLRRQAGIARNELGMQMTQGNAFGGDRHGVIEAEQGRTVNNSITNAITQGNRDAFLVGQQAWEQDQARQMDAAKMLATLSPAEQALHQKDAAAVMDIGKLQQTFDQANMNLSYEDFIRQRDYPIEQLNLRINALSQSPHATESKSIQPYQTPNNFAQNLGAFGALAGGAGALTEAGGLKALFS